MFGSEILEVAIGLTLVFLLFSLILTAARETWESFLKSRAAHLERALGELLHAKSRQPVLDEFYKHPLIYSLYQGNDATTSLLSQGRRSILPARHPGPSYIPSRNFALAVMDLMGSASKLRDIPQVREVYELARRVSGNDPERLRKELEAWYDGTMDRAAGWYRRRTQIWLLTAGVLLGILLNINAFTIARHLAVDKEAREALVAAAPRNPAVTTPDGTLVAPLADGDQLAMDLYNAGLPIGWNSHTAGLIGQRYSAGGFFSDIVFTIELLLGFLMVGLAGTLGAPFWFDVLNKLMVIRSTVKPHEKSPEEASEDRQRSPAPGGATVTDPARKSAEPQEAADGRGAVPQVQHTGAGLIPDRATPFIYG